MDFGEILSRSWNITWKHKILWLFGFLAALGSPSSSSNSGSNNSGNQSFVPPGMQNLQPGFQNMLEDFPVWLPPILILLALILVLVIIVLSTYGRIGLARGAWQADEGQERLSLGELWSYGTRYFWRAIAMVLILVVVAIGIFVPGAIATVISAGCLLPLMCVLVIGFALLGVLFDLAIIGIVNEDLGVMDGINRAWQMAKPNIAPIIGMAVILWIVTLVVGFILFLPMLLIAAPVLIGLATQTPEVMGGGVLISVLLFLLYLPVLVVARGILQSFVGSAWTLVYRRLTGRPAQTAA